MKGAGLIITFCEVVQIMRSFSCTFFVEGLFSRVKELTCMSEIESYVGSSVDPSRKVLNELLGKEIGWPCSLGVGLGNDILAS